MRIREHLIVKPCYYQDHTGEAVLRINFSAYNIHFFEICLVMGSRGSSLKGGRGTSGFRYGPVPTIRIIKTRELRPHGRLGIVAGDVVQVLGSVQAKVGTGNEL